jgi:ABC-2 type transport system permease protein
MDSFILGILDLFRKAFIVFGIDYDQLRSLVEVKLTMDSRRHIIGFQRRRRKEPRNTFFMTFLVYALFGSLVGLVIMTLPSFALSMLFFFSCLMMMITMTLITDFSSVLMDTSDNTILLPRPVESRTLFAARVIHIFAYVAQLTFGLSLVPVLVVAVYFDARVLGIFSVGIVLSVLFSISLTNALYLFIIQFTTQEKIKSIINYLQISMTIAIMGAYQLGPRMILRMEDKAFHIDR